MDLEASEVAFPGLRGRCDKEASEITRVWNGQMDEVH